MPKAIKPTVGCTLYYYESAKHAQDVAAGLDQPCIAFVTYVHGDNSINLVGFSHHNLPFMHLGVTLCQPDEDVANGPHAAWMPYQVQQAQPKAVPAADVQVPVVPAELIPAPPAATTEAPAQS